MTNIFKAPIELKMQKVLIYTEGIFGLDARKSQPMRPKTADGILRYAQYQISGIIDSKSKEREAGDVLKAYLTGPSGGKHKNFSTPIFKNIQEAKRATGADVLIIGAAPEGGALPQGYNKDIEWALRNKTHIVSGMHFPLSQNEKFAKLAKKNKVIIWDVRTPADTSGISMGAARAYHIKKPIVLTVGMDAAIGKMTTTYEMHNAVKELGIKSVVIPTGQTTIMIEGWGVSIDALPADFMAGAVEDMIYTVEKGADIIFVEGQGSLFHPAYANTCISLIHGAVPTHMVLVTRPQRKHSIGSKLVKLPSVNEAIAQYENAVLPKYRNARIIAIAINSEGLSQKEAEAYKKNAKRQSKLPIFDALKDKKEVVKLCKNTFT